MSAVDDLRASRRTLSRRECFERLAANTVGRVALSVGALPHIDVVRYYMVGDTIYFHLGSGREVAGHVVAFETGSTEGNGPAGAWSVCAIGVTQPATEASWAEPILQLHPGVVSGWQEEPGAGGAEGW